MPWAHHCNFWRPKIKGNLKSSQRCWKDSSLKQQDQRLTSDGKSWESQCNWTISSKQWMKIAMSLESFTHHNTLQKWRWNTDTSREAKIKMTCEEHICTKGSNAGSFHLGGKWSQMWTWSAERKTNRNGNVLTKIHKNNVSRCLTYMVITNMRRTA